MEESLEITPADGPGSQQDKVVNEHELSDKKLSLEEYKRDLLRCRLYSCIGSGHGGRALRLCNGSVKKYIVLSCVQCSC